LINQCIFFAVHCFSLKIISLGAMASITEEAERIRQCKGRVFALHDEPEVPRVWLPFDDAPGLAMARAFGDFCLKDYGVIAVPELSHRLLTDQDQFIVLATDGVRLSKTTILFLSTESCHCYLLVKFFC
jgi:serine/threonine protein phosphatase PrpC